MFFNMSISLFFVTMIASMQSAANDGNFALASLVPQAKLMDSGCKMVAYYYGKSPVGFVFYGPSPVGEYFAKIHKLEVKKKFRQKGVGGYILIKTLDDLKSQGYIEVRLDAIPYQAPVKHRSRESKKLVTFYEKHGFRVLSVTFLATMMQKTL